MTGSELLRRLRRSDATVVFDRGKGGHVRCSSGVRRLVGLSAARGLGIGSRLVSECIRFARQRHYRKITLWTDDVLVSARRIYQAAGFRLVREEPHRSFGRELVGQFWELSLIDP